MRLGDLPAQQITVAADIDRSGQRDSTFSLTGGELDLDPFLNAFKSDTPAEPTPQQTSNEPTPLPDVPDPGAMRLNGEIALQRVIHSGMRLREPTVNLAWRRRVPDRAAREIVISNLNVTVEGPENSGTLSGGLTLSQNGDEAPTAFTTDLQMTETDFAGILPAASPGMQDKLVGVFSLPRAAVRGEGQNVPEALESMRGEVVFTLASGEMRQIPMLDAIVRATGLDVLNRLAFFEGGGRLVPMGDHMALQAQSPFYVKGDLTYVTAEGQVFYAGTQELTIDIAFSDQFPGLGDIVRRQGQGLAFPPHPLDDSYRLFPFPLRATGPWAGPQVRLGTPRIREIVPGILDDLLSDRDEEDQPGATTSQQVTREQQAPEEPQSIEDQLEDRGREVLEGLLNRL
jgi:hypothetical protein